MARPSLSIAQIILLLGAVVAVVWLLSQRSDESDGDGSQPEAYSFDVSLVEEIEFERPGSITRVVREDDGFWIEAPYRDRADDRFLAQSLQVAATLVPERSLPDTESTPFGLDRPAARWRCRWPGGSYEIVLGDTLPAGAGRFARMGGQPAVKVVNPFLARRFLSPPSMEIHEPIPAPLGIGRVDSIRIETREETLMVARRRAGVWEIISPVHARASTISMARGVKTLRSASMTEFLGPTADQDLPSLGLQPPRAVWTLFQGGKRRSVTIGHPTDDERSAYLIPAGRDVVALVTSEQFRIWVDGAQRLRDPLLMDVPADSIGEVEIVGEGMSRVFSRSPNRIWSEVTGGENLEVRTEAFQIAVGNLCAAHAIGFKPPGAESSFQAHLTLLLTDLRGERDTVQLGIPKGDRAPIRTGRQPGVCEIPATGVRTWELWLAKPLRP